MIKQKLFPGIYKLRGKVRRRFRIFKRQLRREFQFEIQNYLRQQKQN